MIKIKKNYVFISAFIFFILCLFVAIPEAKVFSTTVVVENPISTDDFAKLVENALMWALSISGSLALLMMIIGGIMYVTSSGDEQKVTSAKKIIFWTIAGLALILVSYALITVINDILT